MGNESERVAPLEHTFLHLIFITLSDKMKGILTRHDLRSHQPRQQEAFAGIDSQTSPRLQSIGGLDHHHSSWLPSYVLLAVARLREFHSRGEKMQF